MYLVVVGSDVVVSFDADELVRTVLVVMGSSDVDGIEDGITGLLSVDVSMATATYGQAALVFMKLLRQLIATGIGRRYERMSRSEQAISVI